MMMENNKKAFIANMTTCSPKNKCGLVTFQRLVDYRFNVHHITHALFFNVFLRCCQKASHWTDFCRNAFSVYLDSKFWRIILRTLFTSTYVALCLRRTNSSSPSASMSTCSNTTSLWVTASTCTQLWFIESINLGKTVLHVINNSKNEEVTLTQGILRLMACMHQSDDVYIMTVSNGPVTFVHINTSLTDLIKV